MGIRNSAKAIVLNRSGDKVLLNKSKNSLGDMWETYPDGMIYYDLPGGGQNQYETLEEAVKRECLEETGYTLRVDKLAAIYEEITTNEKFREHYEEYAHKIFFVFICRIADEIIQPVTETDLDMIASEWIDIDNIKSIELYPEIIKLNIDLVLNTQNPLYLGSKKMRL